MRLEISLYSCGGGTWHPANQPAIAQYTVPLLLMSNVIREVPNATLSTREEELSNSNAYLHSVLVRATALWSAWYSRLKYEEEGQKKEECVLCRCCWQWTLYSFTELPKEGPRISGEGYQYQIGDLLSLNCTSGRSHPASMLHWYINDKLVSNEYRPLCNQRMFRAEWKLDYRFLNLHYIHWMSSECHTMT